MRLGRRREGEERRRLVERVEERVRLLEGLECCGKVSYMLEVVEEAWEEGMEGEGWLAEVGRRWSEVLYGEHHPDTRMWGERCGEVRSMRGDVRRKAVGYVRRRGNEKYWR